ncbi:MAG: hypothetical protein WCT26_04930, partial [Candidatus Buchananbacteria bacterium]
ISLQAMLIIYYYVLFLWVNGTVKPFQVAPVELVDYLLGKTIQIIDIHMPPNLSLALRTGINSYADNIFSV